MFATSPSSLSLSFNVAFSQTSVCAGLTGKSVSVKALCNGFIVKVL